MTVLNRDEMLERWMALRGVGSVRSDALVERADGVDLRGLMEGEMRRWYLNVLDTAPARCLPVADVAEEVTAVKDSDGVITVRLPAGVRRVVGFRLCGWKADAEFVAEDSTRWGAQAIAMARGGMWHPVAMLSLERGEVATMAVPRGRLAVERLAVVKDPGPLCYVFDETLLPDFKLFNYE